MLRRKGLRPQAGGYVSDSLRSVHDRKRGGKLHPLDARNRTGLGFKKEDPLSEMLPESAVRSSRDRSEATVANDERKGVIK